MMMRMMYTIASAAGVLVQAVTSSQALAGNAPWCAVVNIGGGDVQWDCEYQTAAQCAPNVVAGNRGFCALNPRYVLWENVPPHHKRHHVY
jgi:hypothetical protein